MSGVPKLIFFFISGCLLKCGVQFCKVNNVLAIDKDMLFVFHENSSSLICRVLTKHISRATGYTLLIEREGQMVPLSKLIHFSLGVV